MLTPQTMTPAQEAQARTHAFYLLKKYSSYTFLDRSRQLRQEFLDAMERQLRQPPQFPVGSLDAQRMHAQPGETISFYENDYRTLLSFMASKEQGLAMLLKTSDKALAYDAYCQTPPPGFIGHLFGRRADFRGYPHELLFYQALGAKSHLPGDMVNPLHTGYMQKLIEADEMIGAFLRTCYLLKSDDPFRFLDPNVLRFSEKWTYETLFFEPHWPLPRYYPRYPFAPCPAHNANKEGEVWSGAEIPVDGIWEPWLLFSKYEGPNPGPFSGKVGCPNYFFKGAIATEYQNEGTDTFEKVRWRLLWQDRRYLDGSIPGEEQDYFDVPSPVNEAPPSLSAQPGQVCPRTGTWMTTAMLERRSIQVKEGERMPKEERDRSGNWVIWFFKGE